MKKNIRFILQILFVVAICENIKSQNILTPNGVFDKVYDRFGNQYALSSLNINSTRPMGGPFGVNTLPTNSCTAGYFTLWFPSGSICDINSSAQTLMCEIFSNLSGFIPSPLTSASVQVNILCADYTGTATPAAIGGPYYVFPYNPSNSNPGVIESQVQKAIITGSDPYLNIPVSFYNATSFYHGAIHTNTAITWNYSVGATTVAPGTADFYSIHLHEAMHVLGILSLINYDGYSTIGQANNYFGIYDKFLVDKNGNHLISSSTPTSCPNSNVAFTASLVSSLFTATTGCVTDVSTCSTAIQYSSANVTTTVYTPNCWEPGSSLSHLEDACLAGTLVSTPCFTANGNSNNNFYYVMANSTFTGDCYVKRYLQADERKILCDLGYSVNPTYTSNAVIDGTATTHSYSGGACSPTAVILGVNDGLTNGAYTYTTTSTSMVISYTTILANDIPSSVLTATCLELVYTGVATLTSGSTNFTVTAPQSYGLVLLKYYPKNSAGQLGNATYVYIYFMPANCNSSGICNFVNNGGFETAVSCGALGLGNGIYANCWVPVDGTAYLFSNLCTTNTFYNLGNNTMGTPTGTPLNSYSGSGNNKAIGLSWVNFPTFAPGVIKNNLSSPIVPNHTYQVSFFANNYINVANLISNSVVVTVASSSVYAFSPNGAFPSGLDVLAEFTLSPGTNWAQLTHTFVFTPSVTTSHYAILIGINSLKTLAVPGTTWNPAASNTLNYNNAIFCYMDDVSLVEFPVPTFAISNPTICGNQSITNLQQYASITGTFSGPAVSNNGGIFNFNLNSTLAPGNYPIAFAYTNTLSSCSNTIYQMVTVGSNTNYIALNPSNLNTCVGTTLDLNTLLTNTNIAGTTFTFAGSQVSSPYTFNTSGNGTLLASNTSTGLCTNGSYSIHVYVSNPSTPTISNFSNGNTASSVSLCPGNTFTAYANTTGTVIIWQPGNSISTNPIPLSPTVTTIYTVTAYDFSTCATSATLALICATNCCNGSTLTPFTGTATPSSTLYTGSLLISNDIIIPASGNVSFPNCRVQFLNNAKIIVQPYAILNLQGSHFYSCDENLWKGIVVQDGGQISASSASGLDNLIEDAEIAFDVSNNTNTSSTILDINHTIFNKNYIGISISNYTETVNPYPFKINNCVFTCRDIPFTSTVWPTVGASSTITGTSAQLRTAINSTTGLAAPYLTQSGFTVATLKNPYSNQQSHIAIKLSTVGVNTGTVMQGITIGTTTASNFNLFDSHGTFISALNSNLTATNNVFQNTQTYSASTNGAGIYHSNPGIMNTKLDLRASSFDEGNRFWECHQGILGDNIYRINIEKAIFRSAQNSTTSISTFTGGSIGINLPTNRFSYYILDNEFTNINTCVNVPITAGTFSAGATGTVIQNGIYASHIVVNQNTFSPGSSSSNYINRAVDISCSNNTGWTLANDYNVIPSIIGTRVEYNNMANVYRGVYVNGMVGFPTTIGDNIITLKDDNVYPSPGNVQHAVDLSNSLSANNVWSQYIIEGNDLSSSSATAAASSSLASLIYCGTNYGLLTPSVCCNQLSNSYNGFVFNSTNSLSTWAGNTMTTPMIHGLLLSSNGVIGPQGSNSTACNNTWAIGTGTWTGNYYGTYLTSGSDAANSKLHVKSGSAYPPNNDGLVAPQFHFGGPTTVTTIVGGDYSCGGLPNNKTPSTPMSGTYDSDEAYYIAKTALYRFLRLNDSVRGSDPDMSDFYSDLSGTSIDKFLQIEENLYEGDLTNAATLISDLDMDGFNAVESNYKSFYDIYIYYKTYGISPVYNSNLLDLANACPGNDGACVYQARALYNFINKKALNYADCEQAAGARPAYNDNSAIGDPYGVYKQWDVKIFPNPTANQINIISKKESEILNIRIEDLSNRLVLERNIKTSDFIATLDFTLINGLYFVTISNTDNEKVTKKLLIAK